MKKNTISCIISILFFLGCDKKKSLSNTEVNNSDIEKKIEEKKLIKNALEQGDTLSYKRAFKTYILSNRYKEFLFYSIRMSELHGFSQADFDTYELLKIIEDIDELENLEESDLALFYLLKAYEKGNKNARTEINVIYPNKDLIPKSRQYFDKL